MHDDKGTFQGVIGISRDIQGYIGLTDKGQRSKYPIFTVSTVSWVTVIETMAAVQVWKRVLLRFVDP